ncbi:hypothetical protein [Mesoplasma seiffertii]|uniref:hypothetical protein n=1 Tax=Mesoplasma seiffertii TaxID=28224 RepID=UPI00047A20B9|nr:hypothetical protein [Mesoplasma seiffertii]
MNKIYDLKEIKKVDNYLLVENEISDQEKYYIMRINDNINEFDLLASESMNYYGDVDFLDAKYEAVSFNSDIELELLEKIFLVTASKKWKLNEALSEISKLIKSKKRIITLQNLRSVYAEIKIILEKGLKSQDFENSIFDLFDAKENKFVEVKSFSKVKREVYLSYQQLTNSKDVDFIFVEVIESNEGKSVFELYNLLGSSDKQKYEFLENLYPEVYSTKFKIGEIINYDVNDLSNGLSMPLNAIDAKFKFKI